MNFNLKDLIEFYDSELGKISVISIQEKLYKFLDTKLKQNVLGFGYILPYLRKKDIASKINFLSIPSTNNKIKYYRNELNASLEVDETSLPFNDLEFDKVFVSHWLEVSDRLDLVFSELWRVLKGQGKIIFIIPNSFSLWSNIENNPFGKCRPFSKSQIKKLLNLHGFEEIKVEFSLYFPPYNYKLLVKNHKLIENIGRALFRNMGGVMVIEATKFNYAIPKKQLKAYRYIFPKVSLQQ